MEMGFMFLEKSGIISQRRRHSEEPYKVFIIQILLKFLIYPIAGSYYTLREIIFFLENAEASIAEYRTKANQQNIIAVTTQDKQNLLKYLTGQIDSCEQIDLSVAVSSITSDTPQTSQSSACDMSQEQYEEAKTRYVHIFDKIARNLVPSCSVG